MKINITGILAVVSLFLITANAQSQVAPKLEIYLLLGQSNMAGRGELDQLYKEMGSAKVMVWDKTAHWSVAKHPLHFDKPSVAGVGPGLAFGLAISAAHPKAVIGLVPCAVGGTNISVWKPGAEDKATQTHPYDDAEKRIKEAMKYGEVKGMIWHQGEANSGAKNMEGYLLKLNELITRIRTLVGKHDLPVVVGELGRFKDTYTPFNELLKTAPKQIKHIGVVTSEHLKDKGDLTHFDAASATLYGLRYAEKMLQLQDNRKKHKLL